MDLPHTIGAIAGKHITLKASKNSSTLYKQFFSIIILALVDGDYQFLRVEVGVNVRQRCF